MDKMQTDITEMKMQSALVAASIKSMSDTIAAMGLWMPQVDKSITSLTTSIDEVGVRVAAHHPLDADRTPRSDGHGRDTSHQGVAIGASTAPAHALVRGKREFPQTPVRFELGEHSQTTDQSPHTGYLERHGPCRMPKTEFPKFDGDDPNWWKKVAEKYFIMYDVPHETWASLATVHFRGNATLWLQTYEAMHDVDTWEELVVAVSQNYWTQEDLIEEARQNPIGRVRPDYKFQYRSPPSSKGILGAPPDSKVMSEDKSKLEQKLDVLKAMRKEKGLCFKCGDKYHRGHRCVPSVQLQLIEDLLLLLEIKGGDLYLNMKK